MRNLGARLRSLRTDRGWKLGKVARDSGVSLPYLSEIERGEKLPSLGVLDRVAAAFDLTVVEVLDGVAPWDTRGS